MKATVTDSHEHRERIVSRLCNKCGGSMKRGDTYDGGLCDVVLSGNAESTYLSNRTRYSFDLCEPCLVGLMDSFLLPPQVRKDGASVTYEGDRRAFLAERREEEASRRAVERHVERGLCSVYTGDAGTPSAPYPVRCERGAAYQLFWRPGVTPTPGPETFCEIHLFAAFSRGADVVETNMSRRGSLRGQMPLLFFQRVAKTIPTLDPAMLEKDASVRWFGDLEVPALLYFVAALMVERRMSHGSPTYVPIAALCDFLIRELVRLTQDHPFPAYVPPADCDCKACETSQQDRHVRQAQRWAYERGLFEEFRLGADYGRSQGPRTHDAILHRYGGASESSAPVVDATFEEEQDPA